MIAAHPPIDSPYAHLDAVQSLDDDQYKLLAHFITAPGTLPDIARDCGLPITALLEHILDPAFQAALAAVEFAAAQFARVRALLDRPIAVTALAEASTPDNPNPAERRRAATTLMRAAPPPGATTRRSSVAVVSDSPRITPSPTPSPADPTPAPTSAIPHPTSEIPSSEVPTRARDRPLPVAA